MNVRKIPGRSLTEIFILRLLATKPANASGDFDGNGFAMLRCFERNSGSNRRNGRNLPVEGSIPAKTLLQSDEEVVSVAQAVVNLIEISMPLTRVERA